MNEDLLKVLEGLKEFEESAVSTIEIKRLLIKFVNSEVVEVQRLINNNKGVLVKKGNKYLALETSSDLKLDRLKSLFNVVAESSITPIISDNDREYKRIVESPLKDVIEKGEITSIVNEIYSSEYPASGIINVTETTYSLVTSKGFNGLMRTFTTDGYIRVFNNSHSGQWAFYSSDLSPLEDTLAQANILASIDGEVKLSDGKYDVVLSPLVMGNLMSDFAFFSSAFNVLTASSFLHKVKAGDKIASEKITISDVPKKLGTRDFDDEATFTYDKEIVENGVFKTLLYNNELAKIMGMKTTGNAGIITPVSFGIEVREGDIGYDSLLSGNVIFINNNWYTRFQNYLEGAFSTVCRDAVIVYKDGKPVGNAGRIRISDYLPRLLMNVEDVSKEKYTLKWWDAPLPTTAPYVLIKGVNITKS